jgi:hypothetical protein
MTVMIVDRRNTIAKREAERGQVEEGKKNKSLRVGNTGMELRVGGKGVRCRQEGRGRVMQDERTSKEMKEGREEGKEERTHGMICRNKNRRNVDEGRRQFYRIIMFHSAAATAVY